MTDTQTVHATGVAIGQNGILVRGAPGRGKSSLARALVHDARIRGVWAAFIADDRVILRHASGRLLAEAPEAIRGLVEIRGAGPCRVPVVGKALVTHVVDLEPEADRYPEAPDRHVCLCNVRLPRLFLTPHDPFSVPSVTMWMREDALAGMDI